MKQSLPMYNYKNLRAYQKAYDLSMKIFYLSKSFPKEEKYSLTDQIRRSSRAVCSCIGESYGKFRYPAHFVSKLTDSEMENLETQVWLDFAFSCEYINYEDHKILSIENKEVNLLLNYMIKNPEKFIFKD
ncbi:four helix bundle protein [Solitalea sp. MAHUQ-68]|uniref:Four helix bundle protein n=1 Tax=Solitalea agri TaxID=2953739 RepID=A0A9X2F2R3_9SPHI|nr:four helix bundle protein [Solitalea agri]MCO4293089.1 four helix bundle protein [Solitalea agri]